MGQSELSWHTLTVRDFQLFNLLTGTDCYSLSRHLRVQCENELEDDLFYQTCVDRFCSCPVSPQKCCDRSPDDLWETSTGDIRSHTKARGIRNESLAEYESLCGLSSENVIEKTMHTQNLGCSPYPSEGIFSDKTCIRTISSCRVKFCDAVSWSEKTSPMQLVRERKMLTLSVNWMLQVSHVYIIWPLTCAS